MQRQRQREKKPQQRNRRTVGELLLGWLVFLWGAGSGGVWLPFALASFREGSLFPRALVFSNFLILLQSALCLLVGLGMFLRQRTLSKYGLFLVGLCFLGLGATNAWLAKDAQLKTVYILMWSAICLVIVLALFLVGRWLDQLREDSE